MEDINENNLTKLYKYLQLGGKYTTQELSEKFSLSTRTIQSYLKLLKEKYGLKKEKKYYYFSDAYRHIDSDERVQMSTALMISLYKNAIPTLQEDVLKNFKQIPKESDAFLFDMEFQLIENETYFQQITHAIIHERAVHFKYTDKQNKSSIKNVYPLKNSNVLGYWYLMAYDLEQDKVKTYYFNNIEDLVVSKNESYLSTQDINKLVNKSKEMTSPWYNDNIKKVQLQISGDAIVYMKRKKSTAFTLLRENTSSMLIEMKYYDDIEVLTFVKKWLPFIEIIDNEELKNKLYDILKEYLQK